MKLALQILQDGLEFIRNPDNWAKFTLAMDGDDNTVLPEDPKAVCFCSVGALDKASGLSALTTLMPVEYLKAYKALEASMDDQAVPIYNDNHSHTEVVEAWEEAIRMLST